MYNFKITKKWLNRFCFLSIFLFSVLVMCVVGTHITKTIKEATNIVAVDFIKETEGVVTDGLQELYNAI